MAVAFVAVFLAVAASRVTYPFELEWMEGETLEHVRRVAAGQPLYVRPSLDFIPFAYPPLYYYISAAVLKLGAGGFVALRGVSIAASLASLLLVYACVRSESGRTAALISAGLLAAAYPLSGAWMDLGRVDSLYLALALASGITLARAASPPGYVAAGVLASLALLTKQPIVASLGLLAAYVLVRRPRNFIWLALGMMPGIAIELWLDHRSGGWLLYYVYTLPRLRMAVSSDPARLGHFVWSDMLLTFFPLLAAITTAVAVQRRLRAVPAASRERRTRMALFCGGLVLSAAAARLEGGAWMNALMPAHAALVILFGVGVSSLPRATFVAPSAAILQFLLLGYDPRPLIPSPRDVAAGRAIVDRIRALPDGVLVLDHGYLARAAAKRTYAHGWAMTDVLWADHRGHGGELEPQVRAAIVAHGFPALVLDREPHWFARDFEASYPRCEDLPGAGAFLPRSGAQRKPAVVCFPR